MWRSFAMARPTTTLVKESFFLRLLQVLRRECRVISCDTEKVTGYSGCRLQLWINRVLGHLEMRKAERVFRMFIYV